MGNHIFVVSEEHFRICVDRGLCGGIQHRHKRTNSAIIAGFKGIKKGDYVFFYVKNKGVYGLWKTVSKPFFDTSDVWGNPDQLYPYRVCIEPTVREFLTPVSLNDIYDLRDKGKIWTFDLGARFAKSHVPITTEESKEIIRLLLRNNPISRPTNPIAHPYEPVDADIPISYDTSPEGYLKYEGYLNAWFMNAFANGKLKELIGDYSDFLNYVPTSFNTEMDIFLTHVTRIDSVDILHKFTCMELKRGVCDKAVLKQLVKYEEWLTRKRAGGDKEMVQGILVGYDFTPEVLDYVSKRKEIEGRTIRLIKYRVNDVHDDLDLEEILVF